MIIDISEETNKLFSNRSVDGIRCSNSTAMIEPGEQYGLISCFSRSCLIVKNDFDFLSDDLQEEVIRHAIQANMDNEDRQLYNLSVASKHEQIQYDIRCSIMDAIDRDFEDCVKIINESLPVIIFNYTTRQYRFYDVKELLGRRFK